MTGSLAPKLKFERHFWEHVRNRLRSGVTQLPSSWTFLRYEKDTFNPVPFYLILCLKLEWEGEGEERKLNYTVPIWKWIIVREMQYELRQIEVLLEMKTTKGKFGYT